MKKWFGLALFLFARAGFSATDTLTIGISSEFENLNPLIGTQAATKYMLYLAHRPLVVLTPDGKWQAMLIKEIPTIENKLVQRKGKGLSVTIELLEKAKWGDGRPVICNDIAFSWKVARSPNVSVGNREPYENISAIEADKENSKKCRIEFVKSKFDYFVNIPDPLPSHLEEPIFEKYKGQSEGYDRNSLYTRQPSNPGLYFGPYMISEVKLGSHLVFVPNPHFYGAAPHFKKIIFKLLPNNATLEANLRSGNIMMISSAGGLGHDQATTFARKVESEKLPYRVIFEDGVIYAHIDLNLDNPILADLRVRKALSHAFDKEEIIRSFLEGGGKAANGFVTDRDPFYTTKLPTYPYSKRTAQKLLDEAGWKMGSSGYREKDGKRMTLTLMAAAGAKVNDMIQAYLQDKFKSIGIELRLKNEPARVFFGETTSRRRFEMALFSWMSIPDTSPRSILHSSMIPTAKNSWAGQNFTGYKNPNVDRWIDELEQELNPKKRAELGRKILVAYATDIPVIPVYYRPNNTVVPKDLKNYRLSGHMFYETLYAETWSL